MVMSLFNSNGRALEKNFENLVIKRRNTENGECAWNQLNEREWREREREREIREREGSAIRVEFHDKKISRVSTFTNAYKHTHINIQEFYIYVCLYIYSWSVPSMKKIRSGSTKIFMYICMYEHTYFNCGLCGFNYVLIVHST